MTPSKHFRETHAWTTAFVYALNLMTGEQERYLVSHDNGKVEVVRDRDQVPPSGEQFTKVAEAFHIDQYWTMLEDVDVQGRARRCYC